MTTTRFTVTGHVQGVGFRYFVLRQARSLGIRGWVRNCPDGSVEVLAQADEPALDRLAYALAQGPAHAAVARVLAEILPNPPETGNTFNIEG